MTSEQAGEETQVPGQCGRTCLSAPVSHAAAGCDFERDRSSVNDSASQPGWQISCFAGGLCGLPQSPGPTRGAAGTVSSGDAAPRGYKRPATAFCHRVSRRIRNGPRRRRRARRMNESCHGISRCDKTADLPSLGLPSRCSSHPVTTGVKR
ncbi:hypothetical protein V8C35DRAFT_133416 [Trichoderma chlorosporum]